MRSRIKKVKQLVKSILNPSTPRIFCVSMQRTGTTSVGKFFKDFNFSWAGWPHDKKNKWSLSIYEGDFEKVFSSLDFKCANAFEDSPWFYPEFYKMLYHRFPSSKFILFTRDPDAWFDSMVSHSNNNVLGRTRNHCKVYRRELEYFELENSDRFDEIKENTIEAEKTMKLTGKREHYKDVYYRHNMEVKDFFQRHAPERLFICQLEDPDKWFKLGEFLGVNVPANYNVHENRSQ